MCMSWNDDEDIVPSFSKQEAFTRADQGRREELKKRVRKKIGQDRSTEVDKADLKSQASLGQLRQQIAGKQDEETKRKERQEKEEKFSKAPKTKTIKELEEDATETAHEISDADTMIRRQEQEPELSDEETPTEQG